MAILRLTPRIQSFSLFKWEKYILESLCNQINIKIKKGRAALREFIRELTYQLIMEAPEANELRHGGVLSKELGFVAGRENEIVDKIAQEVARNLRISITKAKRKGRAIAGRIKIGIVVYNYEDVLSLDEVNYITEKADLLPQLKWLLLEGDKIIIKDYGIRFKEGAGRSGGAFMQKLDKGVRRPFKVDPRYSGTEDDNWLTRAFTDNRESFLRQIIRFMQQEVYR